MVYDYLAVAYSPYVHAFPARVGGDQQRGDLGLVVLAEYGRGGPGPVELGAFLGRETDLVPAAVTLLELLQQVDPLLLQVPYVGGREERWGRGGRIDAGHDALHGVAAGGGRAVVVVQLAVPEHAALVVVVARPAPLAELVVASEASGRGLAVVAVVVRVLVRASTAARHRGRVGRARARRASAA